MLLEGILADISTPFYPDERIYFRKLEANLARYSRTSLAGFVVCGSAGEAPMLSDPETIQLFEVAAQSAAPQKTMIAGVSRASVHSTLELADAAARTGYDAILLAASDRCDHSGASSSARVNFLLAVAERSPLPVILQSSAHGLPDEIALDELREIAAHPNIIALVDFSGQVEKITAAVQATRQAHTRIVQMTNDFLPVTRRMPAAGQASSSPDGILPVAGLQQSGAPPQTFRSKEVGFQVLSGSSAILLDSLESGASGGLLAVASFAPQGCQDVYLAWKEHNLQLAAARQTNLSAAQGSIVDAMGIGAIKYACDFNGYFGGFPRAPLLGPTSTQKTEIEGVLEHLRN